MIFSQKRKLLFYSALSLGLLYPSLGWAKPGNNNNNGNNGNRANRDRDQDFASVPSVTFTAEMTASSGAPAIRDVQAQLGDQVARGATQLSFEGTKIIKAKIDDLQEEVDKATEDLKNLKADTANADKNKDKIADKEKQLLGLQQSIQALIGMREKLDKNAAEARNPNNPPPPNKNEGKDDQGKQQAAAAGAAPAGGAQPGGHQVYPVDFSSDLKATNEAIAKGAQAIAQVLNSAVASGGDKPLDQIVRLITGGGSGDAGKANYYSAPDAPLNGVAATTPRPMDPTPAALRGNPQAIGMPKQQDPGTQRLVQNAVKPAQSYQEAAPSGKLTLDPRSVGIQTQPVKKKVGGLTTTRQIATQTKPIFPGSQLGVVAEEPDYSTAFSAQSEAAAGHKK